MNMQNMREFEVDFMVGDAVTVRVYDVYNSYSGEDKFPGKILDISSDGLYSVEIRVGMNRFSVPARREDLEFRDTSQKYAGSPAQFQKGDAVTLVLRNTRSGPHVVAGTIKHVSERSVQVDLEGRLVVLASLDDVRPVYKREDV